MCTSQLPASNSVALDMSLQTASDVKVKEEAPVEVDSTPPGSPESISGNSDSNREPLVKGKVGQNCEEGSCVSLQRREWVLKTYGFV